MIYNIPIFFKPRPHQRKEIIVSHQLEKFFMLVSDKLYQYNNLNIASFCNQRNKKRPSHLIPYTYLYHILQTINEGMDLEKLFQQFTIIIDKKASEFKQKECRMHY